MMKLVKIAVGVGTFVLFVFVMAQFEEATEGTAEEPEAPVEVAPGPEPEPEPERPEMLDAVVHRDGVELVVVNRDDFAWTDCEITLNPGIIRKGWTQRMALVPAGDTIRGGLMAFTDGEGMRFNPGTHALEEASIFCRVDGQVVGWQGRFR